MPSTDQEQRSPAATVQRLRLFSAFLLSPLIPVLLYYYSISLSGPVLVLGFLVSYGAELIVFLPLYLRADRNNRLTPIACVEASFFAGVVVPLAVTGGTLLGYLFGWTPPPVSGAMPTGLTGAFVFGMFGAIAGLAFSLVAGIKPAQDSRRK